MNLTINQKMPGFADGNYHLRARGCITASLHWADQNGALPDWKPFAYLPIETNGAGMYRMDGGRAVPEDATHVLARVVSADFFTVEECLVPIPKLAEKPAEELVQRFLVMTDLHLSNKPWQVRKALSMAKNYDAVLITGDMTNDGTQAQLELFWQCVNEVIPDVPVFAVTGNHDYPKNPLPQIQYGICDYPTLQEKLLNRASNMGISCGQDTSGAYAATVGDTEIIGLNAATHWRRFKFPDNAQLEWLMLHLLESKAKRHNEAAFQAQKCITEEEKQPFTEMRPAKSKKAGRQVTLRPDWEKVKVGIMEEIVRAKFTQNEDLKWRLIGTGDAYMEEGNTWHDTCWGVDAKTGEGQNHLGKILMKVREELRRECV